MDSVSDIDTSFNPSNHGNRGIGSRLGRVPELRQQRILSASQTRPTPATSISCLLITKSSATVYHQLRKGVYDPREPSEKFITCECESSVLHFPLISVLPSAICESPRISQRKLLSDIMEHIPSPDGSKTLDIPFVCTEDYDNGEFRTYPKRKGWTKHELDGGSDFGGRKSHEIEAFFQTWLYFGCLIEVFKAAGIKVDATDFIRERKFITTRKLPTLIQEWSEQEQSFLSAYASGSVSKQESMMQAKEERESDIVDIIETVQSYARKYCYSGVPEPSESKQLSWPVSPKISLSIIALGWALQNASQKIYNLQRGPRDKGSSSPLLVTRLESAGWCKAEISRFINYHDVEGLYYFGFLSSPRRNQRHNDCTEQSCNPLGIEEVKYEQKHECYEDQRPCDDVKVPDEAVKIVANGGIPLITWSESGIGVVRYETGMKYLAISHVWSDGRGNPLCNSLPKCQLVYLQHLIDNLYNSKQDDQRGRRIYGAKKLEPMGDPSERAVGFWIDTLCVPVGNEELRGQAIKQMRSIYQGAHRVLVLDSWVQELDRKTSIVEKAVRLYLSNWQHRLWTLQEGVLARNLHFQFKDGPQTLKQLFKDQNKYQKSPIGFYSSLVGLTLPLIPTFGFALEYFAEDQTETPPHETFQAMIHGIKERTTTRKSDETICFATLMGLGPSDFDKLLAAKGDKRMEVFLEAVGIFLQDIIFNDLPRLKTPGFRWAPRSWLGQSQDILTPGPRNSELGGISGGGLVVAFPGIKLGPVRPRLGKTITVIWRKDHLLGCRVVLKPAEDDENHEWDPASSYAVVLSGNERACEAILGVLDSANPEIRPLRLQHITRARVELLSKKTLTNIREKCYAHTQNNEQPMGTSTNCGEDCPVISDWWRKPKRWCIL